MIALALCMLMFGAWGIPVFVAGWGGYYFLLMKVGKAQAPNKKKPPK